MYLINSLDICQIILAFRINIQRRGRVSPGGVPPFDWGMKASHKLGMRNGGAAHENQKRREYIWGDARLRGQTLDVRYLRVS